MASKRERKPRRRQSPLRGPSQETCLKAISTTLRMKERGEGIFRYVMIRKPQTRSIRRV